MQQQRTPERTRSRRFSGLPRLLVAAAVSYFVVLQGGFGQSAATGAVAAIAIAAALVWGVLGLLPSQRWIVAVMAVMMITGGLLTFGTDAAGWVLFVIGAIGVVGAPEVDLRLAGVITAAAAAPVVINTLLRETGVESIALNLLALVGVAILAYSRRQSRIRRDQEQALITRSRELEERSRELLEETVRTEAETARAAALEDRNRIARDIHDVLAHSLGGLVVQLDAADAMLAAGGDPDEVADRVRMSRQLAVEGLHEARSAVRELRSEALDSATLAESADAQRDVAEMINSITHGPVALHLGLEFDLVGESRPVPAAVAEAFAATAREALTNINKHADGSRAVATLIFEADVVRLELINSLPENHDQHRADLAASGGGFGLPGLRQRFAEIGGTLTAGRQDNRWVVSAGWPAPEADDGRMPDDNS